MIELDEICSAYVIANLDQRLFALRCARLTCPFRVHLNSVVALAAHPSSIGSLLLISSVCVCTSVCVMWLRMFVCLTWYARGSRDSVRKRMIVPLTTS